MIECPACYTVYDPISTRWLCPGCGYKNSCCEGEPLCLNGDAPSATPPAPEDRPPSIGITCSRMPEDMRRRLPPKNADAVLQRAAGRCERCGTDSAPYWSLHHRKPRGMGGTSDPMIHSPSNLIYVCGSGTTGCHAWIESNRAEAREQGFLVRRNDEPSQVPVKVNYGTVLLHDDGGWQPC